MEKINAPDLNRKPVINVETFSKANQRMISINQSSGGFGSWRDNLRTSKTPEEVQEILNSGSIGSKQTLSQSFYNKNGYYRQIISYYASLLKYAGLLIPNPATGVNLSTLHVQKRFMNALNYVENMQIPIVLQECATRALIDGCFYGIVAENYKSNFCVIELPADYCRTTYKDENGLDLVDFNLAYFKKFKDKTQLKQTLAMFPKIIGKTYNSKRKEIESSVEYWLTIPSEFGLCFPFLSGSPTFISMIPSIMDYDEVLRVDRKKDIEGIKKLLINKMPHLSDGRLVFEPEEAAVMHEGLVKMMKDNEQVNVLTSYGDVEVASTSVSEARVKERLDKIENNIFAQAGISSQLFAPTGSSSVNFSLQADLALMMTLANKFSRYISFLINNLFSNSNLSFSYKIFPISYFNDKEVIDSSYKLATAGYSFLMPAIAQGFTQKELTNVKDLENNFMNLGEKLKPLSSSYTQSASKPKEKEGATEEGGRPPLDDKDKSKKTIENEESKQNTGG